MQQPITNLGQLQETILPSRMPGIIAWPLVPPCAGDAGEVRRNRQDASLPGQPEYLVTPRFSVLIHAHELAIAV